MAADATVDYRPGPLDGIRVIDVTTARGEMAGRLLADLGAEVVKVESPGGCEARRLPPFDEDRGDSLFWAALGLGKQSVILDITAAHERDRMLALVAGGDVFLESSEPGTMAALGLGYEALASVNPALVYTSITPYGQTGPLAEAPATDLTIEAAGGLISLQGDYDRPPIPVGYPQAGFHASAQAAADTAIALHERLRSGLGQHLDVSMQAAMVWTLMNATGYPPNHDDDPPRGGVHRGDAPRELIPGLLIKSIWPCADGWITYGITLPGLGGRTHEAMMRWLEVEDALPDSLHEIDFSSWIRDLLDGALPVERMVESLDALGPFLLTKTKAELQAFALANRAIVGTVYEVADLLADPHLIARDYWTTVEGRVHPGPFAKLSRTPIRLARGAPRLGASQELLGQSAEGPAAPKVSSRARPQPFEGLKVADFAWVGVGPMISKALADHGATVVHVESASRPDVLRLVPPYKDGVAGIDRSQFVANFNTSKLGLALNLATAEGRAAGRRLADWADVVVESFTPGTMQKFGLDYETLTAGRQDLVMLSSCLRGQTGPEAAYTGFGGQGASLSGLHAITGWPDRPPAGPWGAYTDFINPRLGVCALASALIHRARTGEGQHIDLSQTEGGLRFMEPLLLDYSVNGRVARAAGHDSLYACPHGIFAASGEERWVAIAVETERQWEALRGVAHLDGCDGPAFATFTGRLEHRDQIDAALRSWTAPQDAFELAEGLRNAGVPASVVLWPSDLYDDPQLAHREFFVTLDHSVMGATPYDGPVTKFSETPAQLRKAAPALGEDTDLVLRELLGLTGDEIVALALAGALS